MAKIKKEVVVEGTNGGAADVTIKEEDNYAEKVKNVNQIASPLASKKLTKKCYKLIKKGKYRMAATHRTLLLGDRIPWESVIIIYVYFWVMFQSVYIYLPQIPFLFWFSNATQDIPA